MHVFTKVLQRLSFANLVKLTKHYDLITNRDLRLPPPPIYNSYSYSKAMNFPTSKADRKSPVGCLPPPVVDSSSILIRSLAQHRPRFHAAAPLQSITRTINIVHRNKDEQRVERLENLESRVNDLGVSGSVRKSIGQITTSRLNLWQSWIGKHGTSLEI